MQVDFIQTRVAEFVTTNSLDTKKTLTTNNTATFGVLTLIRRYKTSIITFNDIINFAILFIILEIIDYNNI
jgi:hypothetical protein